MATQCRATNPNNCRIHGNTTISQLQAQADKAALSGNTNEYLLLREKIDAAHDALESQPTTAKPAPVKTSPRKTATQMVKDGANAALKQIADWRETGVDERPEPLEQEAKMVKKGFREEVRKGLIAAKPHMTNGQVTPEAIDQVAFILFDYYHEGNIPGLDTYRTPYFEGLGKTILEAAIR